MSRCKSSADTKDSPYTGTRQVAVICSKEAPAPFALLSVRVHRDVRERVAAFLTVPQRACARRASKPLWKAVTAASMEDMLCAAVIELKDTRGDRATLVVVAMSRVSAPFSCGDALLAWSGGLGPLYDELKLRFPHAAAIAVSARLAAIRPFPFASGCATMTVCVVTPAASPSSLVMESVVLGVHNTTNVLVRTLSHNGAPCPILYLGEATQEQTSNMVRDVPSFDESAFNEFREQCPSLQLQSLCIANVPVLESIINYAFAGSMHLLSVDLSGHPSLRAIGKRAFWNCASLQSISLANLPLFEGIGDDAFARCGRLSTVDLSSLLSLRCIGEYAFAQCTSFRSVSLENLSHLESIGDYAFAECERLSSVALSNLFSLSCIGAHAFSKCMSLQSVSFDSLPLLESIGDHAFAECVHLSSVELSKLLSLRCVGEYAFQQCAFQSISRI